MKQTLKMETDVFSIDFNEIDLSQLTDPVDNSPISIDHILGVNITGSNVIADDFNCNSSVDVNKPNIDKDKNGNYVDRNNDKNEKDLNDKNEVETEQTLKKQKRKGKKKKDKTEPDEKKKNNNKREAGDSGTTEEPKKRVRACRSYNLRVSSIINHIETEKRKEEPKKPKPRDKPAPLSKYRRKTANARERTRMQEMNDAFEGLKEVVPDYPTGKVTKITTLRLALDYITTLRDLLGYEDDNMSESSYRERMSSVSDSCSSPGSSLGSVGYGTNSSVQSQNSCSSPESCFNSPSDATSTMSVQSPEIVDSTELSFPLSEDVFMDIDLDFSGNT